MLLLFLNFVLFFFSPLLIFLWLGFMLFMFDFVCRLMFNFSRFFACSFWFMLYFWNHFVFSRFGMLYWFMLDFMLYFMLCFVLDWFIFSFSLCFWLLYFLSLMSCFLIFRFFFKFSIFLWCLFELFRNIPYCSPVLSEFFLLSSHFDKKSSCKNFLVKASFDEVDGVDFTFENNFKRARVILFDLDEMEIRECFLDIFFNCLEIAFDQVKRNMLNLIT